MGIFFLIRKTNVDTFQLIWLSFCISVFLSTFLFLCLSHFLAHFRLKSPSHLPIKLQLLSVH